MEPKSTEPTYQERFIADLSVMLGYRKPNNPCTTWSEFGRAAAFTYVVPALCVGIPAVIVIASLTVFPFIQRLFHH